MKRERLKSVGRWIAACAKNAVSLMRRERVAATVFVLMVLVSVCIRVPYFMSESLNNYNWMHGATLRHVEIFDQTKSFKSFIAPALTYPGEGNRFIDNNSTNEPGKRGFVTKDGEYYYLSYPPLTFMLLSFFFGVLPFDLNIVSISFASMAVQVVTALLLAVGIFEITRRRTLALLGAGIYLFAPIPLAAHLAIFFPDTVAQPLFLLAAYSLYKICSGSKEKAWAVIFVVVLGVLTYTDWLGYAVAASSALLLFLNRAHLPSWKTLVALCVVVPGFSFVCMLLQYAYTVGFVEFIQTFYLKYSQSYTHESGTYLNIDKYLSIYRHYWAYVGLLKVSVVCLLIHAASRNSFEELRNRNFLLMLYVLAVPALIHHFVLLDWTAHGYHGFSTLKMVPAIAFVATYSAYLLFCRSKIAHFRWLQVGYVAFVCLTFGLWVKHYYLYDPQTSVEPYAHDYCRIGKEMAEEGKGTVIFLKDSRSSLHSFPTSPVLVYCAKRNMAVYEGEESARELMRKNEMTRGTIFSIAYLGELGAEIVKKETIELVPKN